MPTAKRTAKKPAAKKRTAAAKTSAKNSKSKKPATKKSAVSSKANKVKAKKQVTFENIRKFYFFSAFINFVLAILSVFLLSANATQIFIMYSAKDELLSTSTNTVLGQAVGTFINIEPRFLLVALFGLSTVFSLLFATKLRPAYEKSVREGVVALRWLSVGILSAISLVFASMLGGVQEITSLKMVAALIFVTAMLGWLSELNNKSGKSYLAFNLSLLTGVVAWLPLAFSLVATSIKGATHFDWSVYVLAIVLLAGFTNFALNQYMAIKNSVSGDKFIEIEGRYITNDFLIRVAIFVIAYFAIGS